MFLNRQLSKILTCIIILFPILFEYSGGFSSFSLGDIFLIAWVLAAVVLGNKKITISKGNLILIFLAVYLYFLLALELLSGVATSIIMKLLRYLLYLTIAIFFAPYYMDQKLALRIYRDTAIIVTVVLFLQIAAYYLFGRQLLGFIPFLPRMGNGDYQTLQYMSSNITTYRPCSMFSEPATYASYVIGYLAISLFQKKKKLYTSVFLSMGMVASSSSTAVILTIAVWLIWAFWINNSKLSFRRLAVIFVLTIAAIPLAGTKSIQFVIERLFITRSGITGRFGGYEILAKELGHDNLLFVLFGHTMSDERIGYVPGWGSFLYYFGVIGTGLLFVSLVYLFRKSNDIAKALIICLTILSAGTLTLVSFFAMFYLSLILVLGKDMEFSKEKLISP